MIDQLQERIAELETANRQLQAETNRYKQLEMQSQRQFQEATLLHRISTRIALAEDMVAALQGVCTELARFLKVPQAGFALLSPDRSTAGSSGDRVRLCDSRDAHDDVDQLRDGIRSVLSAFAGGDGSDQDGITPRLGQAVRSVGKRRHRGG